MNNLMVFIGIFHKYFENKFQMSIEDKLSFFENHVKRTDIAVEGLKKLTLQKFNDLETRMTGTDNALANLDQRGSSLEVGQESTTHVIKQGLDALGSSQGQIKIEVSQMRSQVLHWK